MATLTETIAEELLDSLDDPDGIERVMTQHRGSKGPLYGGLARATMWLHQHVQELNDRAGRLKSDNETLGEKVATLAQQRSVLEKEVGRLDAGVNQANDRLQEVEQLIARADELQALGFGQTELKTMSETLAGIGSDPTKTVVAFLAAVNEYQSLDALTRGQSEEEAKLQDLKSQVEALTQERKGLTAAISAVGDEALTQVMEAGRQAKENVDAQFKAGAEYAKLRQQAEALGNWVEVGKVLSSGNPESWRELPVEVIQHLLLVALRWAEADSHDVKVPPPDMIARKNVLLKYQPLRLSDVVAWAWAGLRSPNATITNAL
jgi:predicted nuclease with TOPRIM domain